MMRPGPYRTCSRRLGIASIAVTLAACSTGAPFTAGPSTMPGERSTEGVSPTWVSVSPTATPLVFESERHRYRIKMPLGWRVVQYEGEWTSLEQFSPGAEVPGEDVVSPPNLASFLVANSMAIPEGMSPAEWLVAFDALVAPALNQECPGTASTGIMGGEPARVVEQRCDGFVIVGRSLTHEDRGYYFTVRFPEGDSTSEAALEGIIASIQLLDD